MYRTLQEHSLVSEVVLGGDCLGLNSQTGVSMHQLPKLEDSTPQRIPGVSGGKNSAVCIKQTINLCEFLIVSSLGSDTIFERVQVQNSLNSKWLDMYLEKEKHISGYIKHWPCCFIQEQFIQPAVLRLCITNLHLNQSNQEEI